ncbi:MAG: PASTA domain-containing protein [Gaiellaceae bacterium]
MSQATLNNRRNSWRRHSVPLPLRIFTGLATAAVAAAIVFSAATARTAPSIQLVAGPGTTISILNSKEGLAVLSAGGMRPGDSASGSVTITNTGDGDGTFSLSTSALADVPGPGAGILSAKLDLTVSDTTVPLVPIPVYSGKLNGVGTIPLGILAAGEAHTYGFTVTFPNGATGAENAYQGASTSITFDWDAVLVGGSPAPALASTTPTDGATVASASSASLTATLALASIQNPKLDGAPVGISLSGSGVTFSTGPLAAGPHTISGSLEGLDSQTTPFLLHFTVWSGATSDYPYVEKNSVAGEQMQLTTANGDVQVLVPANAWSGGASGDWAVFRADPAPAPAATGGLAGATDLYTVSAFWALAGGGITSFDKALDISIAKGSSPVIPASYAGGAWSRIARIPSGTSLPTGWQSGYYVSGSQVHVLTLKAGAFGLLRDVEAPTRPTSFTGSKSNGKLVLKWGAASDNEGVNAYLVYANGRLVKTLSASARSYTVGTFKTSDARAFQVAARDEASNVSLKTKSLVVVPAVTNLKLAKAKSALTKRGLKTGKITYVFSSSVPSGSVVSAGKSGLVAKGTAVPLSLSKGAARAASGGGSGSGGSGTGYYYGPTTTPSSTPVYPPSATPLPSTPSSSSGGGESSGPAPDEARVGSPESFTQKRSSGGRRALGLALLGTLFAAGAGLAFRARKSMPQLQQAGAQAGQILFWDERVARSALSAFRRLGGLAGR